MSFVLILKILTLKIIFIIITYKKFFNSYLFKKRNLIITLFIENYFCLILVIQFLFKILFINLYYCFKIIKTFSIKLL